MLSDLAGFRKSTKTSFWRELGFVLKCPQKVFFSFSLCVTGIPYHHEQPSDNQHYSGDSRGFTRKQHSIHTGFCNNEATAVPQPRPLFFLCLFQILFQWELSPVVRWAPPFCCLCFCWRSPSSSTANVKAVSGDWVFVCVYIKASSFCVF